MNELAPADDDQLIERLRAELASISSGRRRIAVEAFFMAALGVIPWVGGLLKRLSRHGERRAR